MERVLNENEEKELLDLAPSRILLIRKEKSEKTVNIDEIIFYLKSIQSILLKMYSTHNEEPRTFIDDIPTEEFNELETQTPWKHTFLVCVKIVFHTLENQMLYKTLIKAWSFTVKIKNLLVLVFYLYEQFFVQSLTPRNCTEPWSYY